MLLVSRPRLVLALLSVLALPIMVPAADAGRPEKADYQVDPVHSFILFKIRHLGAGYVWGRFNAPVGTISLNSRDPARSTVEFSVPAKNLDTANEQRDTHLRSEAFFDVVKFPEIKARSQSVKKTDDHTYEVTGDLTLHGVTKPLTVKLTELGTGKGMQGETRTGFECTFTIKRSDFGMMTMMGAVGDEVTLVVNLEAIEGSVPVRRD